MYQSHSCINSTLEIDSFLLAPAAVEKQKEDLCYHLELRNNFADIPTLVLLATPTV